MTDRRPASSLTHEEQERMFAHQLPFDELVAKAPAFAVTFGQHAPGRPGDYVVVRRDQHYIELQPGLPAQKRRTAEPMTLQNLALTVRGVILPVLLFPAIGEGTLPDLVLYINDAGNASGLPYNVRATTWALELGAVPDDIPDGIYGTAVLLGMSTTSWESVSVPPRATSYLQLHG